MNEQNLINSVDFTSIFHNEWSIRVSLNLSLSNIEEFINRTKMKIAKEDFASYLCSEIKDEMKTFVTLFDGGYDAFIQYKSENGDLRDYEFTLTSKELYQIKANVNEYLVSKHLPTKTINIER